MLLSRHCRLSTIARVLSVTRVESDFLPCVKACFTVFWFFNWEGGKFIMVIVSPCHEWVILYISRDLAHKSALWWGIKCMVSECHLWCCPAACAFSYSFTIRLQIFVDIRHQEEHPLHFPFRLHKNGIPNCQSFECASCELRLSCPLLSGHHRNANYNNKWNFACYQMVFLFKLFCKMALELTFKSPVWHRDGWRITPPIECW